MGKNRRWLEAAVAVAVARTAVTTGSWRAMRNYTEENEGHSQEASATPGAHIRTKSKYILLKYSLLRDSEPMRSGFSDLLAS